MFTFVITLAVVSIVTSILTTFYLNSTRPRNLYLYLIAFFAVTWSFIAILVVGLSACGKIGAGRKEGREIVKYFTSER